MIAWRLFGDLLFALNQNQLDRSGDGFKNYFAFAWQYKYEGGLWFSGMQYPYGDLLSYADGQPAITLPLIGLKKMGLDFSGYELLVVQILPVLGLFLGAYFLHKILRHYQMPDWWTVVTVIFCLALSPQLFRFNAHFALGYTFCFPSIWYLLICYKESRIKNINYILISIVALLIYAFIHPYHLLIGSFFLLAFFFIEILSKRIHWSVFSSAVIPVLLYLYINSGLDIYADRPQNPWGAWEYKAEAADFFPFYGWFARLFSGVLETRTSYHEGYNYLGVLIFICPLIWISIRFKKPSTKKANIESYYFLASILVLLFACGLHIFITGHKILDWIPMMKQFRALGRFSWPFYYVGFVTLSVFFYMVIHQAKSPILRSSLIALVLGLWCLDFWFYTKAFNKNMNKYKAPNELYSNKEVNDIVKASTYDAKDFQAILPLPVSMEGAEKITPADNWFSKTRAIPYAFQSGLPIIGAYMSRTSLSNILSQYQLGSSSYVTKTLVKDLPSQKDFLIVIGKEVEAEYADLLAMGYYLGESKEVKVYGINTASLDQARKLPDMNLDNKSPMYYNGYNEQKNTGLYSQGAVKINGLTKIAGPVSLNDVSSDSLTMSLWTKIEPNHSTTAFFSIYIKDANQKTLQIINYRDLDIPRCEVIDNWIQLKKNIEIPSGADFLDWNITADLLHIDHAIISESKDSFRIKLDSNFVVYNHYIAEVSN